MISALLSRLIYLFYFLFVFAEASTAGYKAILNYCRRF
jgi:hypothetical protein